MDIHCKMKTKLNAPYLKVYSVIVCMLHLSCVNTKHGTSNVNVMGSIHRESMNWYKLLTFDSMQVTLDKSVNQKWRVSAIMI